MNHLIKCSFEGCGKLYSEPVMLQCSNNVCKSHLIDQKNQIKCHFCEKTHQIPNEGWTTNTLVVKIIEQMISADENKTKAQTLLKKFETVVDDFDVLIDETAEYITEYCSNVRNSIVQEQEAEKREIDVRANEMFQSLKLLEAKCKLNLKEKEKDQKEECSGERKKLKEKILVWQGRFRDTDASEKEKKAFVDELEETFDEYQESQLNIKDKLLMGMGAKFKPQDKEFHTKLLGEFEISESLSLASIGVPKSSILDRKKYNDLMSLCQFDRKNTKLNLMYRATRDGFESTAFHRLCDNAGFTLTVVKSKTNGNIFGGYTEQSWSGSGYKQDNNAFIFSLINQEARPLKINSSNAQYSIICNNINGPTFGNGCDLYIASNSNSITSSSNIGNTYKHPVYQYQTTQAQNFLAGSNRFSTDEIEVFQVIKQR